MPGKKILIALSGGVDSAVAAALLKKQGFDVFGAHFRFFAGASAKKSLNKAKKVAKALEIPMEIVDARKEFKRKIVDYFIESYKKGATPNPCVVCNKEMKFRLLLEMLEKKKANYIATGHYARMQPVIARSETTKQSRTMLENTRLLRYARNDRYKLLEAKDKTKDQSYFLYRLTQKELGKTIFALGEIKKSEVKKLAKKFKLPVFEEKESQDICFLAGTDINQFLRKNIKPKHGNIVDESGNILARHRGLPFYTIGQRKGIEIGPPASRQEREAIRAGGTKSYYVIKKNLKNNELIVSNDPTKLLVKKFEAIQVNWVDKKIRLPLKAQIQIRYHAEKIPAIIRKGRNGQYGVETAREMRAVTPGQSAVFYKKDKVLGGGIIV